MKPSALLMSCLAVSAAIAVVPDASALPLCVACGMSPTPGSGAHNNTTAPPTMRVTAAFENDFALIHAGSASYRLRIVNDGNTTAMVRVDVQNVTSGWRAQLQREGREFTLAPHANVTLAATFTPPSSSPTDPLVRQGSFTAHVHARGPHGEMEDLFRTARAWSV